MSDYINENLLDASPMKKQKEEAAKLVGKWDKTGLLDGLNEDFQKSGMAVMLENQAKQLISENSYTNISGGKGDEEWSGVALPLVRRIFGEIAAQEFVSVQPMNLPSGLVFFLDFQYGSRNNMDGAEAGNKGGSIHGKTGPNTPSASEAPFGVGGFYGTGRYGFSNNSASAAVSFTSASSTPRVTMKDINFDSEISASSIVGGTCGLYKLSGTIATSTKFDRLSCRAWAIETGSNLNIQSILTQFTTCDVNGNMTIVVSASEAAGITNQSIGGADDAGIDGKVTTNVHYFKQPTDSTRGDFEDTAGDATADTLTIPQVDLQLRSSPIVAKTRKLKAVWTPELAQDLNAYHSVDAEAELTSMLSEYISMEIDLEILDMLITDASTVDYWSAKQGNDYDSASKSFKNTTFYGTRFEWYQTLLQKIQKVSNEIHRLTLRGGANFAVVSPKVATILESLPGYMSDTDGNKAQFAMGVSKIGAIANRWTVYKNPYMTENTVLVGFRGSNFLETGAVYAPYVPLIMTPLVYDPSDFTPRKGVMTRYAKKMIRPEFYGKIHLSDLNLL